MVELSPSRELPIDIQRRTLPGTERAYSPPKPILSSKRTLALPTIRNGSRTTSMPALRPDQAGMRWESSLRAMHSSQFAL